jgi:hypothetical protein
LAISVKIEERNPNCVGIQILKIESHIILSI